MNGPVFMRAVSFAWLALTASILRLHAHDPGLSTVQAEVRASTIVVTIGFSPGDAQQLLPPSARGDTTWTQGQFDSVHDELEKLGWHLWQIGVGEEAITPSRVRVQLAAGDNVSFEVEFPRPPGAEKVMMRAPIIVRLPSGHRQFVIITDERGSTLTKKLLSARDYAIEVPMPGAAASAATERAAAIGSGGGEPPTFWGFVRLGIEHIWTGYDHLLFLFALLVVCRSFRSIVAIVSCFTLAHSITLALATLEVVNLPSRLVEPAIAASIVFVGVENLWRRGEEPRGRWALTFAFGLIHGFGFASVLRDLGVGRSSEGIAVPLFTFNAGVEIGQVAVAAVVLPIVWQLRKKEWFVRRGVPVLSAVVAAAGLYWFLQRTVFS